MGTDPRFFSLSLVSFSDGDEGEETFDPVAFKHLYCHSQNSAGIFKQSRGSGNRVRIGVSYPEMFSVDS